MRAAQQQALDGPDSLHVVDVPEPQPTDDQVALDVHASIAVFPDLLQTRGLYQVRAEPPYVPGSVAAGTVVADAGDFAAGDRAVALTLLGGWAERAVAAASFTLPVPASMSFATAAALPFNYGTMHFALVRRGGLRDGETVLVHGAAGGIGTAAVQLAVALGARVVAVVSSEAKAEVARAAGAHETVAVDGFRDAVRELTGGRGVDVVVDPVGGDRFTDSLRSLAPEGRLLVIGFTGGDIPTVKVNRLLLNNVSVVGVGWGAFCLPRPAYLREQWDALLGLADRLDPVIGGRYPLERAADALRDIDARRATGNLLLEVR